MCQHEMILLPFDPTWSNLRKNVSLVLPYEDIRSINLQDDMLNTVIIIRTDDDEIRLTTQQKALSDRAVAAVVANQLLLFLRQNT